jgi:hypothetical protein
VRASSNVGAEVGSDVGGVSAGRLSVAVMALY